MLLLLACVGSTSSDSSTGACELSVSPGVVHLQAGELVELVELSGCELVTATCSEPFTAAPSIAVASSWAVAVAPSSPEASGLCVWSEESSTRVLAVLVVDYTP